MAHKQGFITLFLVGMIAILLTFSLYLMRNASFAESMMTDIIAHEKDYRIAEMHLLYLLAHQDIASLAMTLDEGQTKEWNYPMYADLPTAKGLLSVKKEKNGLLIRSCLENASRTLNLSSFIIIDNEGNAIIDRWNIE